MDNNFKPNSHKARAEAEQAERKKVDKVVTTAVKTKKKNQFKDVFISEDAANVKSYVFMDVLVPAIKKAISDIVTNGIDMILYGETGRTKKKSYSSNVSYRSYYDDRKEESRYRTTRTSAYSFDDIIIESRGEAEDVLLRMDEIIEEYGTVSVADLNDLVGITGKYTDNRYGWTNIRNAEAVRVRDGYMLKMPKVTPL